MLRLLGYWLLAALAAGIAWIVVVVVCDVMRSFNERAARERIAGPARRWKHQESHKAPR